MKETILKQKYLLYLCLTLFCVTSVRGQQISQFNHYFYNPTFYNPAFTGDKATTNVMLIGRNQWAGFKNSPKLNFIAVDGNILNDKMGLGASLFTDTKGINKTLGGNLLYSYRIQLNEISKLRFGISVRFLSHSINFANAIVENNSDPSFYSSEQNTTTFDGNLGLAYFWHALEVGVSINQIVKNKSIFSSTTENDITYTPAHHYIGSAKYKFNLNNQKQILLAPQALVRYVPNTPMQYELNTNLYLLNKFWVGATYKSDYAIAANVGLTVIKKLDIGYSYDVITSDIGQYSGISHELMVNYKFGKRKPKEKIEEEFIEPQETPQEETPQDTSKVEEIVEPEQQTDTNTTNQEPVKKKKSKTLQDLSKIDTTKPKSTIDKENVDNEKENTALVFTEAENNIMTQDTSVIILKAYTKEFKDANDKILDPGVYVIVGSFIYDDFAESYANKVRKKGYNTAQRIYSEERSYNYVYMFKEANLTSAMSKMDEARINGSASAWIIILEE